MERERDGSPVRRLLQPSRWEVMVARVRVQACRWIDFFPNPDCSHGTLSKVGGKSRGQEGGGGSPFRQESHTELKAEDRGGSAKNLAWDLPGGALQGPAPHLVSGVGDPLGPGS